MTKAELIDRLKALAKEMQTVGEAIQQYYGGSAWNNPVVDNGLQMVGAGRLAQQWADEMEKEDNA